MKKKRKESATRTKQKLHAEVVVLLTDLCTGLVLQILKRYRDALVPGEPGLILNLDDVTRRSYLAAPDASLEARTYVLTAAFIQQLLAKRQHPSFITTGLAFSVGLGNGWLMNNEEFKELKEKVDRLTAHRALGGKASKRLSDEQEDVAMTYIQAELRPGVPLTPACTRASSKLKREKGIVVGGKTLQRLYKSRNAEVSDNA